MRAVERILGAEFAVCAGDVRIEGMHQGVHRRRLESRQRLHPAWKCSRTHQAGGGSAEAERRPLALPLLREGGTKSMPDR